RRSVTGFIVAAELRCWQNYRWRNCRDLAETGTCPDLRPRPSLNLNIWAQEEQRVRVIQNLRTSSPQSYPQTLLHGSPTEKSGLAIAAISLHPGCFTWNTRDRSASCGRVVFAIAVPLKSRDCTQVGRRDLVYFLVVGVPCLGLRSL